MVNFTYNFTNNGELKFELCSTSETFLTSPESHSTLRVLNTDKKTVSKTFVKYVKCLLLVPVLRSQWSTSIFFTFGLKSAKTMLNLI